MSITNFDRILLFPVRLLEDSCLKSRNDLASRAFQRLNGSWKTGKDRRMCFVGKWCGRRGVCRLGKIGRADPRKRAGDV